AHKDGTFVLITGHHTVSLYNFLFHPGHFTWDQGRTDHLETRALPEGPWVSRGPHEMPLVPFS
ncbi:unnamed protein product, partial [Staurois parvus]